MLRIDSKKADLDTVQRLLRDILREENLSRITIETIQRRSWTTITFGWQTCFREAPANIAFPRQVAMYLSRILTEALSSGNRKYLRRA